MLYLNNSPKPYKSLNKSILKQFKGFKNDHKLTDCYICCNIILIFNGRKGYIGSLITTVNMSKHYFLICLAGVAIEEHLVQFFSPFDFFCVCHKYFIILEYKPLYTIRNIKKLLRKFLLFFIFPSFIK